MARKARERRAYENGEIRVIWRPELCAHSGVCVRGLPRCSGPGSGPGSTSAARTSERIAAQVDQCPSGALSWERMRRRP